MIPTAKKWDTPGPEPVNKLNLHVSLIKRDPAVPDHRLTLTSGRILTLS